MFFWPQLPSSEFLVHEGATGRLEHANNLENLETGTLIWGPQGKPGFFKECDHVEIWTKQLLQFID